MIKINEIFYSIQGESTYAGLPCVFVRLTGCNLRCNYCVIGNTKVLSPLKKTRKAVKIKDLKIGDEIFSYNLKNKKVERDRIKNVFIRKVDKVLLIRFKRGSNYNDRIYVTPEHLFYVRNKWVQAQNLRVGYKIFKIGSVKIPRIKKGKARLFREKNPNWKGGISSKKYHRNWKEWYKLREIVLQRDSYTCQQCGSKENLVIHHKDFDPTHNAVENLVVLCRKCNSSINHGRYELKVINGNRIIDIQEVTRKQEKAYVRLAGRKENLIKVYNIEAEKNNSYFCPRVLVHNCDTTYAYNDGKDYKIDEILDEIKKYKCNLIEITGGEPLLQDEIFSFIDKLIEEKFKVLVETNGTVDISKVNDKAVVIMDIKCPSSGENFKISRNNVLKLKANDEIKFVIANKKDYNWAKRIISEYKLGNRIVLFSPVFEKISVKKLSSWILKDNMNVRLQPQVHKICKLR